MKSAIKSAIKTLKRNSSSSRYMVRCIAMLALLISATLNAGVPSDPVTAAKDFYKHHENFYCSNPSTIQNLITPRFYKALKRDHDAAQGEVGAIDSVPWTDAQDGDIHPPITFTCLSNSGNRATVEMKYTFYLGKNRSWPQKVIFHLEKQSASPNWLISDLFTPRDGSLVNVIERYYKRYP